MRGVRRETKAAQALTWYNSVLLFPSPCGVLGVKQRNGKSMDGGVIFVSVPLRGVRRETPHIFEAYTVKLLVGSISIGHLYSQKEC